MLYRPEMVRSPGRAIWWILASWRPATAGQLGALAALLGLLLIGAVALAWPWLTEDAPRAIAAGLTLVQNQLADWLRHSWRDCPGSTEVQLQPSFGLAPRRGRFSPLWEFVFPSRCAGCDARGALLCAECRPRLPWLPASACPRCAAPSPGGVISRSCARARASPSAPCGAACRYEGAVRTAIRRPQVRSGPSTRRACSQLIEVSPLGPGRSRPTWWYRFHSNRRQRERGYNQSELIARELAYLDLLPAPVTNALVRRRDTRPQVELQRAERLTNVQGAFACPRPDLVAGQRVLLLDDVSTTGATLEACAVPLLEAGAARVMALVVARSGWSES